MGLATEKMKTKQKSGARCVKAKKLFCVCSSVCLLSVCVIGKFSGVKLDTNLCKSTGNAWPFKKGARPTSASRQPS